MVEEFFKERCRGCESVICCSVWVEMALHNTEKKSSSEFIHETQAGMKKSVFFCQLVSDAKRRCLRAGLENPAKRSHEACPENE